MGFKDFSLVAIKRMAPLGSDAGVLGGEHDNRFMFTLILRSDWKDKSKPKSEYGQVFRISYITQPLTKEHEREQKATFCKALRNLADSIEYTI